MARLASRLLAGEFIATILVGCLRSFPVDASGSLATEIEFRINADHGGVLLEQLVVIEHGPSGFQDEGDEGVRWEVRGGGRDVSRVSYPKPPPGARVVVDPKPLQRGASYRVHVHAGRPVVGAYRVVVCQFSISGEGQVVPGPGCASYTGDPDEPPDSR